MYDYSYKFPFFPQPGKGETIYSIFCRCIARSGFPSTLILKEFTGQQHKHSLLSALPGYLARISAKSPVGHPWCDTDQIISGHTSLPFFTYFDSAAERERLSKELAQANTSRGLSASIGIPSYRGGAAPAHPRYCSICADQDRKELGFAYFHREHQLPGVVILKNGWPRGQQFKKLGSSHKTVQSSWHG